jgi:hypothetical protein
MSNDETAVWISPGLQGIYELEIAGVYEINLWLDNLEVSDEIVDLLVEKFLPRCQQLNIARQDDSGQIISTPYGDDVDPEEFTNKDWHDEITEAELDVAIVNETCTSDEGHDDTEMQIGLNESHLFVPVDLPKFKHPGPGHRRRWFETRKRINAATGDPIVKPLERMRSRPEIDVTDNDIVSISEESWPAILKANEHNPQLFVDPNGQIGMLDQNPLSGAISLPRLIGNSRRWMLLRVAYWFKETDKGKEDVVPSAQIIGDIFATPSPPLPLLERIATYPFFGPDGTLQDKPGYLKGTQTLLVLPKDLDLYEVDINPDQEAISVAVDVIEDLFAGFEFAGQADKANVIGLLILFFARHLIEGPTPMHVMDSAVAGSGKTTLLSSIIQSVTGREPLLCALKERNEEIAKELTSKLISLPPYVVFDNVNHLVDSQSLAMTLTARVREDRELGKTKQLVMPTGVVWIMSGNNVRMSRELLRRSVWIRLDPDQNNLWHKKSDDYPHPNLEQWVNDNRSKIIWSCLTVIQAWLAAGRPRPLNTSNLASFSQWVDTVGGILEHVGINGFIDNIDAFVDAGDAEQEAHDSFIHAWHDKFGQEQVLASDLMSIVDDNEIPLDMPGGNPRQRTTNFGHLLRSLSGRQFAGLCVKPGKTRGGRRLWRLQPIR